jgi:hypothetical protein
MRPSQIDIDILRSLANQPTKPIDGLTLPNISVPTSMMGKVRATQATDSVHIRIRKYLNAITVDNVDSICVNIDKIIRESAQTAEDLDEIANELLANFVQNGRNIKQFLKVFNQVSMFAVPEGMSANGTPIPSKTIGAYFIAACGLKIKTTISKATMRENAKLDMNDPDLEDEYNGNRERAINLIQTVCELYKQQNVQEVPKPKSLSSKAIYEVVESLLDCHFDTISEDMTNAEISRTAHICAEYLYHFMQFGLKFFMTDKNTVKGSNTLAMLVKRFTDNVIPKMTESYLIEKSKILFQ